MRLNNIGLTRIVWMVAAIGMAIAMMFALIDVWRNWVMASQMQDGAEMVEFSVSVSDLVHEMQKERGASAVFLTSKGQTFGSELREQRKATDAKRAIVSDALEAVDRPSFSSAIADGLTDFEERLSQIDGMRTRVDALGVTRPQQVQFYTQINHAGIGLVGKLAEDVSEPKVAKQLLVYSALLYGKDTAGIDRAIGASGFAKGEFDATLKTKMISLSAAQKAYFDYAAQFALPDQKASLAKVLSSQTPKRIASMRDVALTGDLEAIAAISASDWFDTQTAILGDLKGLEVSMAGAITQNIANARGAANLGLVFALVLLVFGFALACGLSFVFVRSIRSRLDGVVQPLRQLSQGEVDVVIPDHSATEFGVITDAMDVFRQTAMDKREAEKERERVVVVLRERLSAMANGDLEEGIKEFFAEEFKGIRMDFNEAQGALRDVIHAVVASAKEINHSASDVNAAATDLSERTARQAATLEETAAALQRTNKGIQSSAELAQSTNNEVALTRETATQNGKVVKSAIEAMEEIQASFHEVEKITKMIQDIAFQTNILALNAGVEATRAGEAGKGFGVVATEVRALAQRSSEAVTSIQQLMAQSGEKIEHGSEQVVASGSALKDMIQRIDRVSERVEELATASGVQAQGLNEIDAALSDLERDTQQNAAMAEQSSAASGLLNQEVTKLNQRTAIFHGSGASANAWDHETPVDLVMNG